MDYSKLNREKAVECQLGERSRVEKELTQLAKAMEADLKRSNKFDQESTTRYSELLSYLKYVEAELQKLGHGEIDETTASTTAAKSKPVSKGGDDVAGEGVKGSGKPQVEIRAKTPKRPTRQTSQKRKAEDDTAGNTGYDQGSKKRSKTSVAGVSDGNVEDFASTEAASAAKAAKASELKVRQQLDALRSKLDEHKDDARAFLTSLPRENEEKVKQYKKLAIRVSNFVDSEVDPVEATGENRTLRKEIITDAQGLRAILDNQVDAADVWNPDVSFRSRDLGYNTTY